MKEGIHIGSVRHRRFSPRGHAFTYGLHMMLVDLDRLEDAPRLGPRWLGGLSPACLARSDRFGPPGESLRESIEKWLRSQTGSEPPSKIFLLSLPRSFGVGFAPVCFYFCLDACGAVTHVIAEVRNTPWRERHLYLLSVDHPSPDKRLFRFSVPKMFHVSPFMPMEMEYRFAIRLGDAAVTVAMENWRGGARIFAATLRLAYLGEGSAALARASLVQPFVPLKVLAAIYFEALRLWLRRIPLHTHPKKIAPAIKEIAQP